MPSSFKIIPLQEPQSKPRNLLNFRSVRFIALAVALAQNIVHMLMSMFNCAPSVIIFFNTKCDHISDKRTISRHLFLGVFCPQENQGTLVHETQI